MVQKKPISGFKEIRNQTELHQQSAPGCTKEREPRTCSAMSRESMTVWDSRFHAITDFRIPDAGFQSLLLELGFWISIVSGFLKLYSGLQSPGFQISDLTDKNFSHSGIQILFHGVKLASQGYKGEGILRRKEEIPLPFARNACHVG